MSETDAMARAHLEGCIKAYLRGKQSINWVMTFAKGHHLPSADLARLIRGHRDAAVGSRYQDLWSSCVREGLLPDTGPDGTP